MAQEFFGFVEWARNNMNANEFTNAPGCDVRGAHWMVSVYCCVALASLPRGLDTSTA